MNDADSKSTPSEGPGTPHTAANAGALPPDFCAVLLLDGTGRVTAANATARLLWQTAEHELVQEPFAALFAFEVFSSEPEFIEAQWEVLLASALDRPTTLSAQPRQGEPCEVRVKLEKALGAAGGYIATTQPARADAAETTRPGDDEAITGYRLLAEKGSAGFFDLQLQTGRVRFSPGWKKLLGYASAELPDTLETWQQLIHPDDSAAAPHRLGRKTTPGQRPFNVEFRMKHRRGHWIWIQCIGLQIVSAPGDLERVVGIHLDVTERKELEDALVANDARLQDLSGAGPLAAFELDYASGVFWFSPAWEKLLGYDEGELAPQPNSFAAALPAEEASGGVENWLLARAPGQTVFVEAARLRAKDGRPVRVLLAVLRTVSRKRELVRAVGFACPLPA